MVLMVINFGLVIGHIDATSSRFTMKVKDNEQLHLLYMLVHKSGDSLTTLACGYRRLTQTGTYTMTPTPSNREHATFTTVN